MHVCKYKNICIPFPENETGMQGKIRGKGEVLAALYGSVTSLLGSGGFAWTCGENIRACPVLMPSREVRSSGMRISSSSSIGMIFFFLKET